MNWGILTKIFSKPIDPTKVIEISAGAIDKWTFTKQEKAQFAADAAKNLADFVKDTMSESTDKSMTRRYLSIIIITIYMVIAVGTIIIALFNPVLAKLIIEVVDAFWLTTAFIMILAFFYGGYYLNSLQKK